MRTSLVAQRGAASAVSVSEALLLAPRTAGRPSTLFMQMAGGSPMAITGSQSAMLKCIFK
jgi:hypothetical protein